MDSRGNWHNENSESFKKMFAEQEGKAPPERPVISIGIGEQVVILKSDGQRIAATFDAAEKNRVTLTPWEGPHPYLELSEQVELQRQSGESVRAQVWDNRKGKIILRTLPI